MSLEGDRHQKPAAMRGAPTHGVRAGTPGEQASSGEARTATSEDVRSGTDHLMEEVVERGNMLAALKRVRANKGSPGIDGMTVDELVGHLVGNWPEIKARLLDGTYEPQAVRRVEIPKAGGGTRMLGIPTVVDRLVQQAILQVLQKRFDPTFSESSYGFRPGRRAHDAVRAAQQYIQSGKRWVVDVDLEKFFDRVNHDVLMGRLEMRIADKRMLAIIRRFLSTGMMADGVVIERSEGTPQGGPLSPLLANVLLDEVDKELERRGFKFARYADDCNVYVSSSRAGEKVMMLLRRLFAGLRLKVNEAKSAVSRPWDRKFLGYSFWVAKGRVVQLKVSSKAIEKMKDRVRAITRRTCGRSIEQVVKTLGTYLRGWKSYFHLAATPTVFYELDAWIRRRMRALLLKQWKRGVTTFAELRRLGATKVLAALVARDTRRWWYNAATRIQIFLDIAYFDKLGVFRLA